MLWVRLPLTHTGSGPKRYDYVPEKDGWYYYREGRSIQALLNEELGKVLNREVDVGLGAVSSVVS